jgi:hypothetical protein
MVDEDQNKRSADISEEDADSHPRITLDHYLKNRRGQTYAAWIHVVTLLIMIVGLVFIFFYKDRCGEVVSGMIFMGAPDAGKQHAPKTEGTR